MAEHIVEERSFFDLEAAQNGASASPLGGFQLQAPAPTRKNVAPLEMPEGVSFFRGLGFAIPISILLWWGLASLISAVVHILRHSPW